MEKVRRKGPDRIYTPLPSDSPAYNLIGRTAAEWSRFEHLLDTIIWVLVERRESTMACLTAQMMGIRPRILSNRALLDDQKFPKEFHDDLDAMEKRSFGPLEIRNRTVHDPWIWELISKTPRQHRSKAAKDLRYGTVEVDVAALEKNVKDTLRLQMRAWDLQYKIERFTHAKHVEFQALMKKHGLE